MIPIIHEIHGTSTLSDEGQYTHVLTIKRYNTNEVLDSATILSSNPIDECQDVNILKDFWRKKYPG